MNSEILNQLIGGIRLVQGLTGETVTIADVDYPCTIADMAAYEVEQVQGGRITKNMVTVSVLQADLPTEPEAGTLATFRSIAYRVISADDATTFWSVKLIQAGA